MQRNLPKRPPPLSNHLTKILIGSPISQSAISETSHKWPPDVSDHLSLTSRVVAYRKFHLLQTRPQTWSEVLSDKIMGSTFVGCTHLICMFPPPYSAESPWGQFVQTKPHVCALRWGLTKKNHNQSKYNSAAIKKYYQLINIQTRNQKA